MTRPEPNPLLTDWREAGQFPPFAVIRPHHFAPAVAQLASERLARIDAIASNPEPATFANTVAAFEATSGHLERIDALFEILRLTVGTDELWAVEAEVCALLAQYHAKALSHRSYFERLDSLYQSRHQQGLAADELRLLERIHLDFVRNGVALRQDDADRFAAIKERLAQLCVTFSQNLVASTDAFKLELTTADELKGLPDFVRDAARIEKSKETSARYVFTLKYSSVVSFLTYSSRRDLRERIWRAWSARCTEPAFDNRPVIREIVALRLDLAKLLGYRSYADYALSDRMAGTPQAARALLDSLWAPAKALCQTELADLRAIAADLGESTDIEPWDWRYLTERLKARKFNIDAAFVSRHFELESVIRAVFDCAHRLFGLSFRERNDVVLYHPDVRLWDVEQQGRIIGYFVADYYARDRKNSGAWESEFRMRCDGHDPMLPIVINSASLQGRAGAPTQLGIDDVDTLFHEFGHALHSLLSNVRFSRLSGTRVARDFVEFPSHLFENWVLDPELLALHAKHADTGAPIPDELIASLRAARVFNEGFELVRYLASALIDIELHSLPDATGLDIEAFQSKQFASFGMVREADVNHRLSHFRHIFSGDGYAAGYYVYLWAQVLEADAFEAFMEIDDPFDPQVAKRLHDCLLSIGNARDPDLAFRDFRGRAPDPMALARKRGVAEA
ncbi:M3 family metallopeptidase [Trinickia fusca]|uniref:M3 family peptidase n=1 Tax=Trinickia fusca TaxID=2419777 RepID=A0A494XLF2_9BURK|nr:M3 family metallopeptidase [Trinickia fusca]RKP48373.1 M3 family peptidase [Trinickia fusca]